MKVALLQVGFEDRQPPDERRDEVARLARELPSDVDLVVLPELWGVGAFAAKRWADRAEPLRGPTYEFLAGLAGELGCAIHGGSIIEREDAALRGGGADLHHDEGADLHHNEGAALQGGGAELFNTALVVGSDGELLASYRKIHRFGAAGREREILSAGTDPCVLDLPLRAGGSVPTGLATCYDVRFPELFRVLSRRGARALLVPGAWPSARAEEIRLQLRTRALENQSVLLTCGIAGESGRTPMAGGSAIIRPNGQILAEAGAEPGVLVDEVDLGEIDRLREEFPVLEDRRLTEC